MSKRCVSAFQNLLTIQLLYYLSHNETVVRVHNGSYRNWMAQGLDLSWKNVKDMAVRQLEGSCADGPKRLKAVVVFPGPEWAWASPELESVVEEVVV